jgi:hypothetical protein
VSGALECRSAADANQTTDQLREVVHGQLQPVLVAGAEKVVDYPVVKAIRSRSEAGLNQALCYAGLTLDNRGFTLQVHVQIPA